MVEYNKIAASDSFAADELSVKCQKSMKHELWINKEELDTFCLAGVLGDGARKTLEPGSQLIWTCDANSHFEAMTKYYEFRDWGVYKTNFPELDKKTYKELGWE